MKRTVTSIIVGFFLVGMLGIGSAFAHTVSSGTSVTIRKVPTGATRAGAKVIIYGKLRSPRPSCRVNKVVRLVRVRPGTDRVIATDITDREGEYLFVRRPVNDQTVYTRFSGTLSTSYGHSHRCRASRSPNLFVNVRG